MGQTGLITFSEYLFLLCILTRPRQGFDVAFKMFDEDGNKQIDYDEFKLLGQVCLKNGCTDIIPVWGSGAGSEKSEGEKPY